MESGFRQLGIFRVIALVQTHLVEMHGLPGMWPSHGLYYNLQTPQNTQKSDDFKHSGTDRHSRHFPTRTSKLPAFKRAPRAFREARYHQNPSTFKQCGPFYTRRCKIAENAKVKSRSVFTSIGLAEAVSKIRRLTVKSSTEGGATGGPFLPVVNNNDGNNRDDSMEPSRAIK